MREGKKCWKWIHFPQLGFHSEEDGIPPPHLVAVLPNLLGANTQAVGSALRRSTRLSEGVIPGSSSCVPSDGGAPQACGPQSRADLLGEMDQKN